MFDYTDLQSTATRLIEEYGQALTFTRTTEGSYNPATGQTTSDTSTEFTKNAAVFDYKTHEMVGAVESGDKKLIAEDYAYEVSDTVTIDGDLYRVMEVKRMKPGDTSLAYELRVRR